MRDETSLPTGAAAAAPTLQRSHGRAAVGLAPGARGVRITRLAQAGSAKAFLPRVYGSAPEIVFLNTSGGLTGGDRLSYSLDLAARTTAVATTQTAERAYAASSGAARVDVRLTAGPGATLHWLPQETILFDRSALARRTVIDLAPDARCVMVETIVLGRAAMGERVAVFDVGDRREVRVGGRPVLIDPLRLSRSPASPAADPAGLDGAVAVATLAVIGKGVHDTTLAPLRAALHPLPASVRAAASGWQDKVVMRAVASDAYALRKIVARCIGVATQAPLPSVWAV